MGLRDKASKIDFASLMAPGSAPAPSAESRPKTAPGAMLAHANDARSELLRENELLKERVGLVTDLEARLAEAVGDLQAWDGAKAARLIDPARIGRGRFANRHASSFLGDSFDRLKREIMEAGGNVQPIKVRPGGGGEAPEFEIVFGHRRHEACRQLGLPVLCVVDNLDDRTLFVEMDRENRERADLSPWEQGMMYLNALEAGLFASNRQLATAVGIDPSNLGKSLALAKLPSEVISAFATPLDIQLRWAPLLNKALETDASGLAKRARDLATSRGSRGPKEVLAQLIEAPSPAVGIHAGEATVLMAGGRKGATLRFDGMGRASLHVHIPLDAAQQKTLADFAQGLVDSVR